MLRVSLLRFVLPVLLASTISHPSDQAYAFTLSPMVVKLNSDGGTQTIKIKNPSSEPIDMQAQFFSWQESADLTALKPTNDLLVMPPIFKVEPGGEQVVRVALRNPIETEIERSYRIVVSEVPSEVQSEDGLGFNLSVSIPLFVRPKGAAAVAEWAIENEDGQTHLVLANEGNSYLKFGQITLASDNADGEVLLQLDGGYVLGGDKRSWPMDTKLTNLNAPLSVKAVSNIGPLQTTISLTDG
ncbi:MAG: fimbria/pilus periplasmic chaperone [Pseudomonadota bacterium]